MPKCPYDTKMSFINFMLLLKILVGEIRNNKGKIPYLSHTFEFWKLPYLESLYHKFTYTHVIVPSSIISIPFVDNFWFVQTNISIWPTPPVFFLQVIAIFIAAVVSTAAPIPTFPIIPRGVLFFRFGKIADTSLCYLMTTIESSVISVISFVLWRSTSPIVVTVVVFSGPFPVISIALPVIPLRG